MNVRWPHLAWLMASLASCSHTSRPVNELSIVDGVLGAHGVDTLQRAEIRSAEDRLEGFLVEQTFAGERGEPIRRWEICDRDGLVVGFVDAFGRAFRLEPFEDPRHVATDALPRAASAILALPSSASNVHIVPASSDG
ncbi:MAG: hypothetical protein H6834_14355 [Planctomycetes bacterium]|nr:hypothetical protein [Planctomycetota bacterium]MCB9891935.1 hypothetical protein [Planctomycetota bacterium]